MRISSLRALLILAFAALVVSAGACQACALFLDLLPASVFNTSRAQQIQPACQQNFFSMALNMIPASDETSKQQVSSMLGLKKQIDSSVLELPSTSSGNSWMSDMVSFGASKDLSDNTAKSSYEQFLKRFSNQSNIFTY